MNSPAILGLIGLALGALVIGVSVPMIRRRVPMNHSFGVRYAAAFRSDRNWYELNTYGGWVLCAWTVPLIAISVYGFFVAPVDAEGYEHVWLAVTLLFGPLACLQNWLKARAMDLRDRR